MYLKTASYLPIVIVAIVCANAQPTLAQENQTSSVLNEPDTIQEVIENARTRCRGMRGAFSMTASAIRNDLDLNNDGKNDYLVDGNMFKCDRGNSRSYRIGSRPSNQRITIIMSETPDYTVHEFPTAKYNIIDFNDEKILMIHEAEENCSSRRKVRPVARYNQNKLQGPGCYRALVWRGGIFSSAR